MDQPGLRMPSAASLAGTLPQPCRIYLAGFTLSVAAGGMVGPFLPIIIRDRLDCPITLVSGLLALNAAISLIAGPCAGVVCDSIGAKTTASMSLALGGFAMLIGSSGDTLGAWSLFVGLSGIVGPFYRVALNTAIANSVQRENRLEAFGWVRIGQSLGLVVGSAAGGYLIQHSTSMTFMLASSMRFLALIFLIGKARGGFTLRKVSRSVERRLSLRSIMSDKPFLHIWFSLLAAVAAYEVLFALLPVYAKEDLGLSEHHYGLVVAFNSLLVILMQASISRVMQRRRPSRVMMAGALLLGIGLGGLAISIALCHVLLCMLFFSLGEMLLMPAAASFIAELAPEGGRGTYMGLYNLCWSSAAGLGALLGGFLYENISPQVTWLGGAAIAFFAGLSLGALCRASSSRGHKEAQELWIS